MKKTVCLFIILFVLLVGLPLFGLLSEGKDISLYLEFPPLTRYVLHAPFSWPFFACLAIVGIVTLLFLAIQLNPKQTCPTVPQKMAAYHFPWWGILGLLLVGISWILAWNRFPWFTACQAHTFLPLWLGYILSINSITYCRTGSCIITKRTWYFLVLFPVSALFWWFFEYLNRFTQNWYYSGVESFNVVEYVFHASLCFSTVLPAVLSTEELLSSFPRISTPLKNSYPINRQKTRAMSIGFFLLSAFGLAAISRWPDYLFPLLWLSPLIIVVTVQNISGQSTILAPLGKGDWRPVWLPALAALFCGFFWELWNFKSYAHWVYSIPFVQKFHIFEMPILGFLGYLPFGLECKMIAGLVEKNMIRCRGNTVPSG
jgi:hypothetical protein